jgi:DNA-directed RNA polymerase subunit RPC12/RpoP
MEYYKTYFGGVSGYCADCGREIVKKSNSQVRCESCSIERKKERIRNRVGKFRKKEISNE